MGNEVINEKLFRAVENGEIRLIKEVLQEEKLNATCYYGAKSILTAVEQGETEILTTLLEHSKNVNRESFWSRIAFSALRAANDADNKEVMALLLKYGAGSDKKRLEKALANETQSSSIDTTKFSYEDGVYIPRKQSKLATFDAALDKNNWELATTILESNMDTDVDFYTECLKKMFLKATYIGDIEKVKIYLEKLIENSVGILGDESGRSTLEIAMENPTDLNKILTNYGFHENSLRHAFSSLNDS